MTDEPPTLRQWVGQSVRALREDHGVRQDDLAQHARQLGVTWTRSKVAALERGDKAIPVEELVLLPMILGNAGCGWHGLADLLPGPTADPVVVNDLGTVPAYVINRAVTGDFRPLTGEEAATMLGSASAKLGGLVATVGAVSEADQVAARRLGVPAAVVARLSRERWGRSLSEERDARVDVRDGDARSLQAARGHVSRELYRELEPALHAWVRADRGET